MPVASRCGRTSIDDALGARDIARLQFAWRSAIMGVSVSPGRTGFTRMPNGANSSLWHAATGPVWSDVRKAICAYPPMPSLDDVFTIASSRFAAFTVPPPACPGTLPAGCSCPQIGTDALRAIRRRVIARPLPLPPPVTSEAREGAPYPNPGVSRSKACV